MNTPPAKKTIQAAEPVFFAPIIKLRQLDGSLLVKAGKPELVEPEISVSQFHKRTGVSKRHIATLCEQGLIQHRRLTPKKNSKILIPRTEVDRYLALDGDVATMPTDEFATVAPSGSGKNASYPLARRGGLKPAAKSNPSKQLKKS